MVKASDEFLIGGTLRDNIPRWFQFRKFMLAHLKRRGVGMCRMDRRLLAS